MRGVRARERAVGSPIGQGCGGHPAKRNGPGFGGYEGMVPRYAVVKR